VAEGFVGRGHDAHVPATRTWQCRQHGICCASQVLGQVQRMRTKDIGGSDEAFGIQQRRLMPRRLFSPGTPISRL